MDSATDSAIFFDKIGTNRFSTVGFIRASITLSAIVCFFLLTQVWILTTSLLRLLFESGYKILWTIRARPFSRVCSFLCVYKRFYCSFWIETRLRAGYQGCQQWFCVIIHDLCHLEFFAYRYRYRYRFNSGKSITLFPSKNTVNLVSVQSTSDISPSWNNI